MPIMDEMPAYKRASGAAEAWAKARRLAREAAGGGVTSRYRLEVLFSEVESTVAGRGTGREVAARRIAAARRDASALLTMRRNSPEAAEAARRIAENVGEALDASASD